MVRLIWQLSLLIKFLIQSNKLAAPLFYNSVGKTVFQLSQINLKSLHLLRYLYDRLL